jgi:hypothetical protein
MPVLQPLWNRTFEFLHFFLEGLFQFWRDSSVRLYNISIINEDRRRTSRRCRIDRRHVAEFIDAANRHLRGKVQLGISADFIFPLFSDLFVVHLESGERFLIVEKKRKTLLNQSGLSVTQFMKCNISSSRSVRITWLQY